MIQLTAVTCNNYLLHVHAISVFYLVQVNLQTGIPHDSVNETCTAGAGTLLLEFGLLSRLLGDPVYEGFARRAINQLWSLRSNVTGLFGVPLC